MADRPVQPHAHPSISSVPYLPGLDGLRALAVLAVIAYHADARWLPGGFLGVEVFFVVSGYLITLLLLAEHERSGRISLKGFWGRRARRLLPALYALLAGVATLSALVPYLHSTALGKLRKELLFAFLYVSNWFQIVDKQSYFDATGRPPLLRHLWSLAVEEQFYVVWPVLMIVVLKVFRDKLPSIGLFFFSCSFCIAVLMAVMYNPANPNRVYLGTDTRAGGLLLGAGLAMVWRPYAVLRGPLRRKGNLLDLVGIGGMLVLIVLNRVFHDVVYTADGIRGYDLLYRGGFFLVGLATAAVIVSCTHLGSRFGQRVLGCRPLAWLGTRSYGLYLWHWPVFQLTRPGSVENGGDLDWPWWSVLLLRMVITFVLTELSFRLIEIPIRTKRFKGWIRMVVRSSGHDSVERRRRLGAAAAIIGIVSLFTGYSVATAKDTPSDVQVSLQAGAGSITNIEAMLPSTTVAGPAATSAGGTAPTLASVAPPTSAGDTPSSAAPGTDAGAAATVPADTTTTAAAPATLPTMPPISMFGVGDSVLLGAAPKLQEQGFVIDAKVGRQAKEGVEILTTLNQNHLLGDVVLIHLGNNGPTTKERLEQMLDQTKDVRLVVVATVKVPKPWEGDVNAAIFAVAAEYPNVRLLDWNSLSQSSLAPPDTFYGDGIHLRPSGQKFYTQLVMDVIAKG